MVIVCGLGRRDAAAFAAELGAAVAVLPDAAAVLAALRRRADVALVVLGPGLPDEQLGHVAASARVLRPEAPVVLLRATVNRLQRQSARDSGIAAVLPAGDLAAAGAGCADFLAARADAGRGRIVAVFGGKGGCGTTTLAVNLAVALAEDPGRRICLVDLDLRSGDVAVTVGLEPRRTITTRPAAGGDPVDAVVTGLRPRLDCVLAPTRPGEAERLEIEGVGDILPALARRYDVVVVDTPPTFTRPVVAALDGAAHHVLVTTPERPALQSLRRTLDTLDLLGHRRDSRSAVLNRSDSGVGISAADVERILRTPIAVHVPSSRDVATSINARLPLMAASPAHPVSSAIRHLALARLVPAASAAVHGGAMT